MAGGKTVVWGDTSQTGLKSQVAAALLARGVGPVIDVSAPDVVTVH
jgi:cell division protein FtsQ